MLSHDRRTVSAPGRRPPEPLAVVSVIKFLRSIRIIVWFYTERERREHPRKKGASINEYKYNNNGLVSAVSLEKINNSAVFRRCITNLNLLSFVRLYTIYTYRLISTSIYHYYLLYCIYLTRKIIKMHWTTLLLVVISCTRTRRVPGTNTQIAFVQFNECACV